MPLSFIGMSYAAGLLLFHKGSDIVEFIYYFQYIRATHGPNPNCPKHVKYPGNYHCQYKPIGYVDDDDVRMFPSLLVEEGKVDREH